MQNLGYNFYTVYTQTTDGWYQGAYSNGWLPDFTNTTTTITQSMDQWLNAWTSGWGFGGGSSWGFFPSHS